MAATPTQTVWTIKELLRWTTEYLHGKGVEAPRLEAQILLGHVMNCPRIELIARSDELPTDAERARFKDLLRQRVEGWPVAYLVGSREFYLLPFEVTPAVLIPRPDTETLVLEAIRRAKGLTAPRILDVGTGSGCIAVSVAHQVPQARVTASDVSPDALEVAKRNATRHGVAGRMTFKQGDLLQPVMGDERFDLLLSNPPYIAPGELATLAVEVRDHEPRIALDGGPDGLAFYRRFAAEAATVLVPGGTLLLEIGWQQDAAVRALFAERPEWVVEPSLKDLAGRFRVVVVRRA